MPRKGHDSRLSCVCAQCGSAFMVHPCRIGKAKFCTRVCEATSRTRPPLERFLGFVSPEPNTGCWLWTGAAVPKGYGTFNIEGKFHRAPRVSWTLFRGDIPAGLLVLHHCDLPLCVNPEHLFLGTNADNQLDSIRKNRHRWRHAGA